MLCLKMENELEKTFFPKVQCNLNFQPGQFRLSGTIMTFLVEAGLFA